MIKTLILVVGLSGALAAECPLFDTVPNLILQTQLGNWGIHGRVLNPTDPKQSLQCVHIEFSAAQVDREPVDIDGHVTGTNLGTGEKIDEQYDAQVGNLAQPGLWSVVVNGVTYEGSVIHTDYVEYSLLALCAQNGADINQQILLLGRSHEPMPANVVNNYLSVLKGYDVDVSNYQTVTHGHMICH